jgi:hypothetical protein
MCGQDHIAKRADKLLLSGGLNNFLMPVVSGAPRDVSAVTNMLIKLTNQLQFRSLYKLFSGRNSVDCTATGYGLEGMSFDPRREPDFPDPHRPIVF